MDRSQRVNFLANILKIELGLDLGEVDLVQVLLQPVEEGDQLLLQALAQGEEHLACQLMDVMHLYLLADFGI